MLLEREEELGLLADLLENVGSSGGKVVLIRGDAGIGKSALVRGFVTLVADSAHTHGGFCDDLETPQPFGPLWDMAREEPELSEALRASDRQQVMQTLFDLLSRSLRPNLVVIEDTHWSDEATLDAVKYVGRRIARTNGLLVLTYRDEEVDFENPLRTVLGALRSESVARVELKGLSRTAVADIVAQLGLDPDVVLEATRGNPFYVTEMALTAGDEVPSSVPDSVMARVGRLSILAREMLRDDCGWWLSNT
jgi:predicted ATPase